MTIEAQAAFFTETQNAIKAAKTTADLRKLDAVLDGYEFLALPEGAQEDLLCQFSVRDLRLKGALHL